MHNPLAFDDETQMELDFLGAEPLAGFEEELVDLDIGRHLAFVDGRGVVQRRVAAEHALRDRTEEPAFELVFRARGLQR